MFLRESSRPSTHSNARGRLIQPRSGLPAWSSFPPSEERSCNALRRFAPTSNNSTTYSFPSVSLVAGLLTVGGTGGADAITVSKSSADVIQVNVSSTGEVRRFAISNVNKIEVRGGMGDDFITVGNGITISADLHGGRGHDTLLGGGGDDILHGDR